MKNRYKYFLIFTLVFTLKSLFAQTGEVNGYVFDDATGDPLPYSTVQLVGTTIGNTTDIDGKFTIKGIKPGFHQLKVDFVGYETVITDALWVTIANSAYIEIPLKSSNKELESVTITTSPFERDPESPVSRRTLGVAEIEQMPGANRDISKVIQSLPGVASNSTFRNDIIVRGGGPSENSFYLDGIEVPNINHFATQGSSGGPVGIINVDFVRQIELYSAAFPANQSNALSSVMDIKLVDPNPNKPVYRATLGASDLALSYNGPISKKSGLTFSYRRSYLQFLFGVIGLPFLPTYDDIQFKYKIKTGKKSELSLIGIGAYDRFKLNTGIKDPNEEQLYQLNYLPIYNQWTYTIGGVYKQFAKHGFHQIILSHNQLNNESYKYFENIEVDSLKTLDYRSKEIETKLRYEHYYNDNGWTIRYGAGGEWDIYTNDTKQVRFLEGERVNFAYNTNINFFQYSLFGQASRAVFSDRLLVSFGLRMEGSSYSKEMANPLKQFAPRLSLTYDIAPRWSIIINGGRYFQLPPYTSMGFKNNSNVLINKENGLSYIENEQLVLGMEYLPDEQLKFSIEGFYKWYHNYPMSVLDSVAVASKTPGFDAFGTEEVIPTAKGKAYGVEFLARHQDLLGFSIIGSYTFVRSFFTNMEGDYIVSAWDNKHLLNLTVLKPLKGNWEVGAKYRFVGGSPYTPYDIALSSYRPAWDAQSQPYLDYSRFNTERIEGFHQLDIRVDKRFFFNKWSLMLYLDIQNVLNYKQQGQEVLTNLDEEGNPAIVNPDAPYDDQFYQLRRFSNEAGTILPTIGIMVEF